jgi:hypothetical protein
MKVYELADGEFKDPRISQYSNWIHCLYRILICHHTRHHGRKENLAPSISVIRDALLYGMEVVG